MAAGAYLYTVNPDLVVGLRVGICNAHRQVLVLFSFALVRVGQPLVVLERARKLNDDQLLLLAARALNQDVGPVFLTELTRDLAWVQRGRVKTREVSPQLEGAVTAL